MSPSSMVRLAKNHTNYSVSRFPRFLKKALCYCYCCGVAKNLEHTKVGEAQLSKPSQSYMALNKLPRVLVDEAEAVVIGGMVLDINATPSMVANSGTTTPGKILCMLGGVARNVAECMSKLGAKPYMISAIGLDWAGRLLLESWVSAGLSVEGIRRTPDTETAIVCHIYDDTGEVAAGVASVEAVEKFLTPEWIQNFKFNISSAPLLMVDANLSLPALEASCQCILAVTPAHPSSMAAECRTSVWFEPVSVAKSRRVASVAKQITFTSPNEDELVAMANSLSHEDKFSPIQRDSKIAKPSIESLFQMLKPAIWVLLDKGIQVVIVTLGSNGIFLCFNPNRIEKRHFMKKKCSPFSRELYEHINSSCPPNGLLVGPKHKGGYFIAVHLPALTASVVRRTGAGDCLVGGTIASICAGLDIMQSVAVGIAAAKGAVESEINVPAEYQLTKITDDARSVYSKAKVVFCDSNL